MPNATLGAYGFTADVSQVLNPAVLRAPNSITPERRETWTEHLAANGYQEFLYREETVGNISKKFRWVLQWDAATEATRAAVQALAETTASYVFAHPNGIFYNVQSVPGEWQEEEATDNQVGTLRFYNLTLVVSQI